MLCPRPASAQDGGSWDFTDVFHSESKKVNGVQKSYFGGDKALYYLNQDNSEDNYTVGPNTNYPAFGYVPVPVTNGSILLKGRDRIIAYWTPPSSGSSGSPGGSPPPPSGSPSPPSGTATPVPTPPATVTILVNAATTASFGDGSVDQANPSAVLDNGFGDPPLVTFNNSVSKGWASQGLHLKTLSTANRSWIEPQSPSSSNNYTSIPGRWKIELPFDINLSASITANGAGKILAKLGGLSATGDSRTVRIVRNGARGPIKQDGAQGLNKDIDEWVEADGTGHGHTRYSYEVQLDTAGYDTYWNGQSFTASRSTGWGSDLNWWWNPTGGVTGNPLDNDSVDGSLQQMERGKRYIDFDGNWLGEFAPPTPHNLTYKVQDKNVDSAKASAKYELMMHEEWEKLRPDPNSPAQNMTGGVIYLILPDGWKYTAKNPDAVSKMQAKWDFTISGTVSLGMKLSGTFDVFTATKLGVEVNASGSVSAGTTLGVSCDVPPLSQRAPFIEPTWRLKNYLVNHYAKDGGEILGQLLVEPGSKQLNVGWMPAEPISSGLGS